MRTILVIVLLFVAGCIPTTQQVETATNKTDALMVVVDKMQESWDALAEKDIVESQKVEKLSAELDSAQENIIAANEAIKSKVDEDVIEQIKAGWETTKDYNPYYVPGALILTILGEAGLLLKTNKKNTGLEKGINRVKGEAEPELAKKIHDTMKIYT